MKRQFFKKSFKFSQSLVPFLHGIFITLIFFFFIMSDYEDGLFDRMAKNTFNKGPHFISYTTKVLNLLNTAHTVLRDREKLFAGKPVNFRDSLFRSYDVDLLDARGGCGSYSYVLAKLLISKGINTRIGQMKCGDEWGCHVIVEAKINDKWIILDPTYNIAFTNKNNQIVGFKELHNNFNKFKSQTPSHYPEEFTYDDIRYTNWNKIPLLFKTIKKVLKIFLKKEEINNISLRVLVMNIYKIYLIITVISYFIFCIFTFWRKQKNMMLKLSEI